MKKQAKPPTLTTIADVAKAFNVSTKTVAAWRDNYADWPEKNRDGTFSFAKIAAFCERHQVGPCNPTRGKGSQRDAMNEAKRRLAIERTANLRVTNSRLQAEQTSELGGILARGDVDAARAEMQAVVDRCVAATRGDVAALMPDGDVRAKVLGLFDAILKPGEAVEA